MSKHTGESFMISPNVVDTASAAVVELALLEAFRVHNELGEDGLQIVQTNQFGDPALRVDVEAEAAVIAVLKSRKVNVKLKSEEHGVVDIHNDGPRLTGVLDGVDGTAIYKKERGVGRYGTLLALYEGEDPSYSEYIVAGLMQHATSRLLLAVRGQGLYIINVKTGERETAHCKTDPHPTPDTATIFVDSASNPQDYPPEIQDYFATNRTTFIEPLRAAGFNPLWVAGSAAVYAALVTGEADMVGESTRKGNLEIAAAYGMVIESGGVMRTLDGADLGTKKFWKFGQAPGDHQPVLAAANAEAARTLCRIIGIR